ncbi:MAG: hypothetical protein ACYC0B_02010 [Gemmatimonadaceae bacterium]
MSDTTDKAERLFHAAMRTSESSAAPERPAATGGTVLTGCCVDCGAKPRIEAGPVNGTWCIRVEPTCEHETLGHVNRGFNLWPAAPAGEAEVTDEMVEAAAKKLVVRVNGLTEKGWRNEDGDKWLAEVKADALKEARAMLTAALASRVAPAAPTGKPPRHVLTVNAIRDFARALNVGTDDLRAFEEFVLADYHALLSVAPAAPQPSAGEPVAWVVPGDQLGWDDGHIDAMAWPEGNYKQPLYAHPAPSADSREGQS